MVSITVEAQNSMKERADLMSDNAQQFSTLFIDHFYRKSISTIIIE